MTACIRCRNKKSGNGSSFPDSADCFIFYFLGLVFGGDAGVSFFFQLRAHRHLILPEPLSLH
jgi:hypothetical protein